MNRNKQVELVILVVGWLFAVMIQFIITDTITSNILHHTITDLKDELLVGFGVGVLITLGLCLLAKNRIELESAFIISVVMGVFLGCWPYLSVKDKIDWRYPIFLMECAPMCGLIWKVMYRWVFRVNNVEAERQEDQRDGKKAIAARIDPKTTSQVAVDQTKELKKEAKPIEKQAPLLQKPTAKPVQDAGWDIKL